MGDPSDSYREILDRIDELPSLPGVVTRLVRLVEDPESTAEDVNALISRDPALTAKVLKLVNSPFYGFDRRISTVSEAVVMLGFRAVRSLALSASVMELFEDPPSQRFDRVGLWEHSIATGIAGEIVGEEIGYSSSEEIVVAGILHEIGKIVMGLHFPDAFEQAMLHSRSRDCTLIEAEESVLGVTHPVIGAELVDRWNLPEALASAVRLYPRPLQAPREHRSLTSIVHVGDILARTRDIGWTGSARNPPVQPDVWEYLGLGPDQLPPMLEQLEADMDRASEFRQLARSQGGSSPDAEV